MAGSAAAFLVVAWAVPGSAWAEGHAGAAGSLPLPKWPGAVEADTVFPPGTAPGAAPAADAVPAWAKETIRGLEARLAGDVAADGVASIAAAVVVDDEIVWQAAFGRADRETGTLASPTSVYRSGSISKSVTALVLLALVERGVVALDDPVEPYLPELERLANRAPDHGAITFRDLAAHRAGLAREPGASRASRGPARAWKRELVRALATTEAVAAPGEEYGYSNVGYALLGLAMERAAGRRFEALVEDLVFAPLGMTSSWFAVPRRQVHRLAAGYVNPSADSVDPRVPRAEHTGRGYHLPDSGVYSTVGDLARLAMAMTGALGDVPIPAPARAVALQAASPGGYGLGFQVLQIGDRLIAGHSGTVPGYAAYMAFDPATRLGIVLLRNYNHGATNLGAVATDALLALADRVPVDP